MKRTATTRNSRQRRRIDRGQRAWLQAMGAARRRPSTSAGRREFLKQGAGLGLALGLPPLLLSCANDGSTPPSGRERRTLFFNMAHEDHVGRNYFLEGFGQSIRLTPTAEKPQVLADARRDNSFLRGVPDDQITHHVEDVDIPQDAVSIVYVGVDIDTGAGTWQMSSVNLVLPTSAVSVAYARARNGNPGGTLPMSAARTKYGMPAAQSEKDMIEETVLLDTANHAALLIGSHPDLMALEPTAAATVQHNHVGTSIDARLLAIRIGALGSAMPQQTPGTPNATGWASLQPLYNTDGTPARLKTGPNAGRLQYHTVLHPEVMALVGKGAVGVAPGVKNDGSLGADITTVRSPENYAGALWYRRDGRPNVNQSPGFTATNAAMALTQPGPQSGLDTSPTFTSGTDGSITVTLSEANWYLRFLGVYLQFLDGDTVLKLADLPEYNAHTIIDPGTHTYPGNPDLSFDTEDLMYAMVVPPVTTVMGVPLSTSGGAGAGTITFRKPQKATTVRILAGGLGTGSNTYPGTIAAGIAMTAFFCYGVTILCGVAGAGAKYPLIIEAIAESLDKIANALATALVDDLSGSTPESAQFWGDEALAIAETIIATQGTTVLSTMIGVIVAIVTESELEKAVPIVGLAAQVVSAVIAAADIAITSVDAALSPWTYVNDLVFTHDLSVTILKDSGDPNADPPDPGNDTFPKAANSYTVTAMFDSGTPHVQTLPLTAPVPATLPPVVFAGVPLGGMVNVSVAFVQKATTPGQPDILLGKGTTGLIPNTVDAVSSGLSMAIEDLQFPIDSTTVYKHRQKTALDAQGNHVWVAGLAPSDTAATSACGGDGTVCAYRGITVHQGTGSAPGYLGYAWRGQNSDPTKAPSCVGQGAAGQLDQVANLNTSSGNRGTDAQHGYVNGACGIGTAGVRLAYSLLGHGSPGFYLDTSEAAAPMVRQVRFDPAPVFDSPLSGKAWGVLNLDSDALLMHPAGHLVSINNANHKIETHKLPAAALTDADAKVRLVAQLKSGQGSRPGLIDLPIAAAISPDGVILVLEIGNNRIQAFDLGANPVRHFGKQGSPYSLELGGTDPVQGWRYLDLAVEYTGYLYVLSYNENHYIYRLDIYHPEQSGTAPIATTQQVNAARLAVDFWRNVYTLNYEVLRLPGGTPAGLTEPSVSLWTPCAQGQTC